MYRNLYYIKNKSPSLANKSTFCNDICEILIKTYIHKTSQKVHIFFNKKEVSFYKLRKSLYGLSLLNYSVFSTILYSAFIPYKNTPLSIVWISIDFIRYSLLFRLFFSLRSKKWKT